MKWLSYPVRLLQCLIDVLFPMKCLSCGRPIPNIRDCICEDCLSRIGGLKEGCHVCSGEIREGRCTVCEERHWYPARNLCLSEYDGIMKKMLHHYKFARRSRLARPLGDLALEALRRERWDFDLITYVPANRSKKWRRGYNQTELIARILSARTGKPVKALLRERFSPLAQKELNYRQRFLHILNKYKAAGRRLAGQKVLLVDDVFTTGATVNECARVLLSRGASEIFSLTMARAGIKRLENLE